MVQMLIRLGKYLEQRFPTKVVVTVEAYESLRSRITDIETNAVHKDAVQELIKIIAKMQAELVSLRTGLGMQAATAGASPESLEHMLNGQYITQETTNV